MTQAILLENAVEVNVYDLQMNNTFRVGFLNDAENNYPMKDRLTFVETIVVDKTKFNDEIKRNNLMEIYNA